MGHDTFFRNYPTEQLDFVPHWVVGCLKDPEIIKDPSLLKGDTKTYISRTYKDYTLMKVCAL